MSRWRRRGSAPCELLIPQTCLSAIHTFNPEYFYSRPAEFAAAVGEKAGPPLEIREKSPNFQRNCEAGELKIRLGEHR